MTGRNHTEETKKKISANRKGQLSEENTLFISTATALIGRSYDILTFLISIFLALLASHFIIDRLGVINN